MRAKLACRAAWRQLAVASDSAGRLECSTTPVMGDVGHLERQWRGAAARRQRQRLAERGSAIMCIAADALGGFPEGYDGVGSLQRLWQFCCCCTRVWWQSVAGRFASRSLATPWPRIDLLLTCALESTSRSNHTAGGTSGIVGRRTWRCGDERCLWSAVWATTTANGSAHRWRAIGFYAIGWRAMGRGLSGASDSVEHACSRQPESRG